MPKTNHKYNFLAQVISLEKKIENLTYHTKVHLKKTEFLATEAIEISVHIERVIKLSNLALLLYRWYVQNGYARNKEDEKGVSVYFKNMLPANPETITDFYERFISLSKLLLASLL